MKKIVLSLMLCAFMATFAVTGAFAQLTFSGDAYVGLQIMGGDEVDGNNVTANHRKEGLPKFNLTAIAQRQNYGIRLDTMFQVQSSNDSDPVTLEGLYGWVTFLENSLRVTAGQINHPIWVTSLDTSLTEYSFDDVTGVRVDYNTPIQGLNVGFAIPTAVTDGTDFETTIKRTVFGASYVTPQFNTVFAYDLAQNGRILLGFKYTAIRNLDAGLQMRATRLNTFGDFPATGEMTVHEKVGYRVTRPFYAFLILGQEFYGEKDKDAYLEFTPGVSYRLTSALTCFFRGTLYSPDMFENTSLKLKT